MMRIIHAWCGKNTRNWQRDKLEVEGWEWVGFWIIGVGKWDLRIDNVTLAAKPAF